MSTSFSIVRICKNVDKTAKKGRENIKTPLYDFYR